LTQYVAQSGSAAGPQRRACGIVGHLIANQAALAADIGIFRSRPILAAVTRGSIPALIATHRTVEKRRAAIAAW
jgi:hypothetical protein